MIQENPTHCWRMLEPWNQREILLMLSTQGKWPPKKPGRNNAEISADFQKLFNIYQLMIFVSLLSWEQKGAGGKKFVQKLTSYERETPAISLLKRAVFQDYFSFSKIINFCAKRTHECMHAHTGKRENNGWDKGKPNCSIYGNCGSLYCIIFVRRIYHLVCKHGV